MGAGRDFRPRFIVRARHCNHTPRVAGLLAAICATALAGTLLAQDAAKDSSGYGDFAIEKLLPAPVAQNLDINVWGWLAYDHNSTNVQDYWNSDLALGVTQRIGDRLAISVDPHFIDDNNVKYGFLEQAFGTAILSEDSGTLLTVGKFNASFGAENRNEWDRLAGTTSLLFGAEPQDLVGAMLTQPVAGTNLTARPFITTGFNGRSELNHRSPSGGIKLEERPSDTLSLALTNWVGQGFVKADNAAEDYSTFDYVATDWRGPHIGAQRGGLLYFANATAKWRPRPDLTLAGEGLLALDGPSAGNFAWGGLLALVNYDITDRLRVFGRWSFLDDKKSLITTLRQRRHELSAGVGYEVFHGTEIRAEYRHDFGLNPDGRAFDSVSVHLVFSY